MNSLRLLLYPFSILYNSATTIRNRLFDNGSISSTLFEKPVIVVGNLSTGGTGKTPHTEYLVKLLSPKKKIAVLSRGYGRKTKGYLLASRDSKASEIGDEPKQIHSKFPKVPLAVCEKRVDGINELIQHFPDLEGIVLDDAYQHRYVQPGLSILLTSYYDLFFKDHVLPAGNLRESRNGARRADIIIITKCPSEISDEEQESFRKSVSTYSEAPVFFTRFEYGAPVDSKTLTSAPLSELKKEIILVTGIANPKPLEEYLKKQGVKIKVHLKYGDHHNFTTQDFKEIENASKTENNIPILTTEKDFVRITTQNLETLTQNSNFYYIPIEVKFLNEKGNEFDALITEYVK